MAKYKDDGAAYLTMYPQLKKRWINECIVCHRQGYKPELPEKMTDDSDQAIMRNNLMQYFEPLVVNEISVCEQCAKLLK